MGRFKRLLPFVAFMLLMTVVLPASWTQKACAAPLQRYDIEVFMANGDHFTGSPLNEVKGILRLNIMVAKRRRTVQLSVVNLLNFNFKPNEKQTAAFEGKDESEILMLLSENALDRRLLTLASMKFTLLLKSKAKDETELVKYCKNSLYIIFCAKFLIKSGSRNF